MSRSRRAATRDPGYAGMSWAWHSSSSAVSYLSDVRRSATRRKARDGPDIRERPHDPCGPILALRLAMGRRIPLLPEHVGARRDLGLACKASRAEHLEKGGGRVPPVAAPWHFLPCSSAFLVAWAMDGRRGGPSRRARNVALYIMPHGASRGAIKTGPMIQLQLLAVRRRERLPGLYSATSSNARPRDFEKAVADRAVNGSRR